MDDISIVKKYFDLSQEQEQLLTKFVEIIANWNTKINLISRKDIDNIWQNHILHSLSIAKYIDLSNKKVIDVGTGGGFPGIPLAIMFPSANFTLIDSVGKKVMVVNDVVENLKLTNVKVFKARSTEIKDKFDFIVARAVASFDVFYKETKHLVKKTNDLSGGIIYLKGEDFEKEFDMFGGKVVVTPIIAYYSELYFENKNIIHIKM